MLKPTPFNLVTVFAAALLIGAAFSAMGACSSPDGMTPMCTFNVDDSGIVAQDGGCEGFALCVGKDGGQQPAKMCCVDDTSDAGAPLTGDALAQCLYGYGEGPPPGSTSSSSASSSSGGTGGVGDAGDGG